MKSLAMAGLYRQTPRRPEVFVCPELLSADAGVVITQARSITADINHLPITSHER